MNKLTYSLFILFFGSLTVSAQNTTKSIKKHNDKAFVEAVVEELNQAMVDRDANTLRKLTMEELTYGHSSGKIEKKQEFIAAVVYGDFDFIKTETKSQTLFFSGKKTAVVRHIFEIEAVSNGKPVEIRIGNMMVFRKQKDLWKLLARQAYKL